MSLTDTDIRKTSPGETQLRLFDGGGLYLLVKPNGARWWRLKYRAAGKEKLLRGAEASSTCLHEGFTAQPVADVPRSAGRAGRPAGGCR